MPVIPRSAIGARFIGWGTALPEKVVTNEELSKTMDTTDEWIREHAAFTSNAPQRKPRPCCTAALVAGTVRSGVVVDSTSASIESGSMPAIWIAFRPDSIDKLAVVPPM